jgi:hypothetical protein
MDNLVHQYDYVSDKHWARAHGDDTWWAEGLWIDPACGTWYVVMHTEYNYNKYLKKPGTGYSLDRMGTVSLVNSTDRGKSWNYQGEIIGSDHPALTEAPSDPVTKQPLYPPEPVDDYNPGWDRIHFPFCDTRKERQHRRIDRRNSIPM